VPRDHEIINLVHFIANDRRKSSVILLVEERNYAAYVGGRVGPGTILDVVVKRLYLARRNRGLVG
jgi:hypothetical protein